MTPSLGARDASQAPSEPGPATGSGATAPGTGCGTGPTGSGRARPLPPDERRAALIAAALPLVSQYGTKVTTRQIAEAAGVAEGTIFRVFPDKDALIRAVIAEAFDPLTAIAELDGIDSTLPLDGRLVEVTGILQRRITGVFNLMLALGSHTPPGEVDKHRLAARPANDRIRAAVVRQLEPDRTALRRPPEEVARSVMLVVFAASHPGITEGRPFTAQQITSLVLDGVRRHPG